MPFSQFKKLKPDNYKPMTTNKHEACLCEYCLNITFKMQSLRSAVNGFALTNKYELSAATLCKEDTRKCLERKCSHCGTKSVFEELHVNYEATNRDVQWWRWETGTVMLNGAEKKRFLKNRKRGTIAVLLKELETA